MKYKIFFKLSLISKPIKWLWLILFLFPVFASSQSTIRELRDKYDVAKTKKEKLSALSNLAVEYCNVSIDTAVMLVRKIEVLMQGEKNPKTNSVIYGVYGYVYERMGNYELALENQLKSLEYALKTKDNKAIANSYNGVGVMHDLLGNYNDALKNYFKSYNILKKDKDESGMQQCLSNIGLVYHLKGDFNNAMKYLYMSRELAEKDKTSLGYTSALINIALVFQQQKNYDKALQLYNECLILYQKQNSKFDIALTYNNIGSVYLEKNDLKKSLSYHLKSLKLKEEIGDLQGKVMSCNNLGLIYKEMSNFDSALVYFFEAKIILDSLPDPASEIEVYSSLGTVYWRKNENLKALEYFNKAIAIYNSGIQYYKIFETYSNLSKLHFQLGNYKEAYLFNELYWSKHDSLQNNENSKLLQQKEIESEYLRKKREDKLINEKEAEKRIVEEKAEEKQRFLWIILICSIFIGLLIFIIIIYRGYNEKKKANTLLSERNNLISVQNIEIIKQSDLLEEKNRDITDSIQYAKRLQDAILPNHNLMNKLMPQHFVLYRPKDIVSGDFYWMHDLSINGVRKFLFAVVDCTGHGVPGGFVSIVGNNALNRAVNEFKLTKPCEILDKVSSLVENSFAGKQEDIRDGMDMAMICVTFENEMVKLEYAGANNPLWIVKNENSIPSLIEFKADKQPIGKYEDRIPFNQTEFLLNKDDSVYLFSDGYADQFGGPSGKKFKYAKLKEKIIEMNHFSMNDQLFELDRSILQWRGELEQIDDICVFGLKII
jgi:serine phosphatase RsbU (regulator of sigma subunit)